MEICIWPDGTRDIKHPIMPEVPVTLEDLDLHSLDELFPKMRTVNLRFDPRLNIYWGRDEETNTTHYVGA